MTKYEKAINGKQEENEKLDESYTYDFPHPEPILAQETQDLMKYMQDQDNSKGGTAQSSR